MQTDHKTIAIDGAEHSVFLETEPGKNRHRHFRIQRGTSSKQGGDPTVCTGHVQYLTGDLIVSSGSLAPEAAAYIRATAGGGQ